MLRNILHGLENIVTIITLQPVLVIPVARDVNLTAVSFNSRSKTALAVHTSIAFERMRGRVV